MRVLLVCWLSLGLVLGGWMIPAAQAKKVAPKKISPSPAGPTRTKSTIKKSPPVKSSIAKKTSKRPAKRRYTSKNTRTRRTPVRRGQAAPAEDRIREIQTALRDRGYFDGDTNGKWDDSSVAALKRFQEEQSLKPDGKIGSLSLIALGLGPRRGGGPAAAPAGTPAPQ